MIMFKLKPLFVVSLAISLGACTSGNDRMFGTYAAMREVAGPVTGTGTTSWGARYIVVTDQATGLRIFVQTEAVACAPGKPFKATGHLTQAEDDDFDATFHLHITTVEKACS
jgi:hypothetical protein